MLVPFTACGDLSGADALYLLDADVDSGIDRGRSAADAPADGSLSGAAAAAGTDIIARTGGDYLYHIHA